MATAVKLVCPSSPTVGDLAVTYQRASDFYEHVDTALMGVDGRSTASAAAWRSLTASACLPLLTAPVDETDLLLQLGVAAYWMPVVVDQIDDDDPNLQLARAISAMLVNATLMLGAGKCSTALAPDARETADWLVGQIKYMNGDVSAPVAA